MIDPLLLLAMGIGTAFLLILIDRISRSVSVVLYMGVQLIFSGASLFYLLQMLNGGNAIIAVNAGINPPLGISLRIGLEEAVFMLSVNVLMFLGSIYLFKKIYSASVSAMTLLLMITVGLNGIIMTRDLFNTFVFLEVLSIATYSIIAIQQNRGSLSAGFKYIIAGGLAGSFLLLGIITIYRVTGELNIDIIVENKDLLTSGAGFIAIFFILIAILIELKPFPANGWALDVYQSVDDGIVALVAVGHSSALVLALYKILPLLPEVLLSLVIWTGLFTFLLSNLGGLKQYNTKRLLGFSSSAQIGFISATMAFCFKTDAPVWLLYVIVGGLCVNHYFAKAILFWLTGITKKYEIEQWRGVGSSYGNVLLFGIAILALVGLPPFPGFFAKWHFVKYLIIKESYNALALVVFGSLLEAVYLLRWFGIGIKKSKNTLLIENIYQYVPVVVFTVLLSGTGLFIGSIMGLSTPIFLAPLFIGMVLMVMDGVASKIKGIVVLIGITMFAGYLLPQLDGIGQYFVAIFMGGSFIVSISTLNRKGTQFGFYPIYSMCIISLGALIAAKTTIQFFYIWEIMAVSSYLLIIRGKNAHIPAWRYIIFSLAGAFLILIGLSLGSPVMSTIKSTVLLNGTGLHGIFAFSFLAIGFLFKIAAFGIHIWLPGAYAESDDDVTAFVSSVLSKVGIFGLILFIVIIGKNEITSVNGYYILAWIGVLTAVFGTLMAVFQEDIKYLLAYSSMGQIGLIVLAIASMSHLGMVTALYLTLNHLIFKGLLFLAFAGVIYRTKTRKMYQMGGLIKRMPFSFVSVLMAIIALSGVPPLSGFGGKWLLYNTLLEKEWYGLLSFSFISSMIAFLYCFRLIHVVFLGQAKAPFKNIEKAPIWFLIPQFILVIILMTFSTMPGIFIKPFIEIAEQWYSSTLSWQGTTLLSAKGQWNGFWIMNITMVIFGVLLVWLLVVLRKPQKVKQFNIVFAAERPFLPETTHYGYNFFAHYQKALGFFVFPRATTFWNGLAEWTNTLSSTLNHWYTGNGQTYAIHIILYIVVLYFIVQGV